MAEILHEEVCKVIAREPNVVSIYDDMLVFCAMPEELRNTTKHSGTYSSCGVSTGSHLARGRAG